MLFPLCKVLCDSRWTSSCWLFLIATCPQSRNRRGPCNGYEGTDRRSIAYQENKTIKGRPLDEKGDRSIHQIGISDMVEIEALIELLDEKGIITKDELMEKCKKMRGKIRGR